MDAAELKKGKLYRLAKNSPFQGYIAGGVVFDSVHNIEKNIIKDTTYIGEDMALLCIDDKPVRVAYDKDFGMGKGEDFPDKEKRDYLFLYGDKIVGVWEDELNLLEEWL